MPRSARIVAVASADVTTSSGFASTPTEASRSDDLHRRSARVVGDERDPLARLPQSGDCLGGTGDRLGPSVENAVQIEQDRVVGVGEHARQAESRSSTLT